MNFLLIIYVGALFFVVLQGFILRRAIIELISFMKAWGPRFRDDKTDCYDLPAGTQIPPFSVPIYGSDRRLTSEDLRGRRASLVFVPPLALEIENALNAFENENASTVFLVCCGKEEECGNVIRACSSRDGARPNLQILVDGDGDLARELLVTETPTVIEIDSQGRFLGSRRLLDKQTVPEGRPSAATA